MGLPEQNIQRGFFAPAHFTNVGSLQRGDKHGSYLFATKLLNQLLGRLTEVIKQHLCIIGKVAVGKL